MDFNDILTSAKNNKKPITGTKKQREKQLIQENGEEKLGINGLAAQIFAANPTAKTYTPNEHYRKAGIVENKIETQRDLQQQLIDHQGFGEKMYNSLARTIVSELALGTVEGFSDILGGMLQCLSGGAFKNTTDNAVSNTIEKWKEKFDNDHAIYKDENLNILNGGLLDSGWWFDNIPSIASSLTLLIPGMGTSMAIAKGASFLGKATKATKLLNKAGKAIGTVEKAAANGEKISKLNWAGKLIYGETNYLKQGANIALNGTVQRFMENYQESRQVYNDIYNKGLEELNNMTDEEYYNFISKNQDYSNLSKTEIAKQIAETASDKTFALDWVNVGFDIMQIAALRNMWKTMKSAKIGSAAVRAEENAIEREAATTLNKALNSSDKSKFIHKIRDKVTPYLQSSKGVIASEASEGLEEMVNYVAQEEGMHLGKTLLGDTDDVSSFKDRLNSYLKDGQLWDSAFWGWLGGVAFHGLGSGFGKIKNRITSGEWQSSEIEARKANLRQTDADFKAFAENAKLISDGYNPYINVKEGESRVKFLSPIEQETAKEQLCDDKLTDIVLNAANNGNINMLNAYINNKYVQDLLVEKGITEAENKEEFFSNINKKIQEIEDSYDTSIFNIRETVRQLDADDKLDGITVNPRVIQLMATDNVRNQTQLNNLDRINKQIDTDIEIEEKKLRDSGILDENIDYREAIQLREFAGRIGILKNQLKDLDGDNSVNAAIVRDSINKQIKELETKVEGESQKVFVSWLASTVAKKEDNQWRFYTQTEEAKKSFEEAKLFRDADDKIIKHGFAGAFSVKLDNYDKALTDFEENADTKYLAKLYAEKPYIDIYKNEAKSKMINTATEVKNYIYEAEEIFNKAKRNLPYVTSKTLTKIAKATSYDRALELVKQLYDNPNAIKDKQIQDIPEDLLDELQSNLTALELSDQSKNILARLESQLNYEIEINAAETNKQDEENTSSEDDKTEPENTATTEPENTPRKGILNLDNTGDYTFTDDNSNNSKSVEVKKENGKEILDIDSIQDIDVKNQFMSDSNIFDTNGNIDITQPLAIIKAPIVEINNGKVKIIEKGLVENVNTQNQAQTPLVNPPVNPPVTPKTVTSSNGGVYEKTKFNELFDENGVPRFDVFMLAQEIINKAYTDGDITVNNYKLLFNIDTINETNPDKTNTALIDALQNPAVKRLKEIKQLLIDNGYSNEDITAIMNTGLEDILEGYDAIFGNNTLASSVGEAYIRSKSAPNSNSTQDRDSYIVSILDAYTNLLEEFTKAFPQITVSKGNETKVYINAESLYRYISNSRNPNSVRTKELVSVIYEGIRTYIENTDEGKSKYIITDDFESLEKLINTLNKSIDERAREIKDTTSIRANISEISTDKNKAKVFDSLSINDQLEIHNRVNSTIMDISVNGQNVATITAPILTTVNGVNNYQMLNQGFVYKLSNVNGNIVCNLNDFFLNVFNADPNNVNSVNANDYFQIKSIAYDAAYKVLQIKDKRKKNPAIKKLCKQLEQNSIIQNMIANKEIELGKYIIEDVLRHLASLARYNQSISMLNLTNPNYNESIIIKNSLNSWFEKLHHNYETSYELWTNGSNYTVTVGNINEGELLRAEDDKPNFVQSKNVVANLESDIEKENAHRIAAVDFRTLDMRVSGKTDIKNSGMKAGSTFLVIPTRNGRSGLVHAYGIKLSDITATSSKFQEIIADIRNEINNQLQKRFTNNNYSYEEFSNFLENLFSNKNGKNSLFRGVYFERFNNSVRIGINGYGFLNFYNKDVNGNTLNLGVQITPADKSIRPFNLNSKNQNLNEKVNEILDGIFKEATINLAFDFIAKDSDKKDSSNGIIERKNGKFIINIGGKSHIFDSFNQFILNNNLIKVNTRTENGSNFSRRSDSNTIHQTLELNISNNTTTQNTTKEEKFVIHNEEKELKDKLTKSGKPVDSKEILEGFVPENMLNSLENLDLLPKSVIFVDENNSDKIDEVVDKNTDEVTKKQCVEDLQTKDNAIVNSNTGVVAIGQNYINQLLSKEDTNYRPLRILIHERLHYLLNKNNKGKVLNDSTLIYDEFKDWLENSNRATLNGEVYSDEEIEDLKKFLFNAANKNSLEHIEEFLMESLTNRQLIDVLNNIRAKDYETTNNNNNTLFDKLLDALNKIFNWFGTDADGNPIDIEEKSLYKKELIALSGNIKENTTGTTNTNSNANTGNNPSSNSARARLARYNRNNNGRPGRRSSVDEVVSSKYTQEMSDIKQNAINDGTYMLAPNGNPTNLNERQWLQVRTKEFKDWFGDWENNPQEASKVVDENGEPLVVYHYTDTKFNEFSLAYFGQTDQGDNGRGFYVTPISPESDIHRYFRDTYGDIVMPIFVNIKNPIHAKSDKDIQYFNRVKRPYKSYKQSLEEEIKVNEFVKSDLENRLFGNDPEYKKYKDPDYIGTLVETRHLERINKKIESLKRELDSLKEDYDVNKSYNDKISKFNKYDGVINGTFEMVIPSSNQIKSATDNNGDFSTTDNNIYHSSVSETKFSTTSIQEFKQSLPQPIRREFDNLLTSGEISISCK